MDVVDGHPAPVLGGSDHDGGGKIHSAALTSVKPEKHRPVTLPCPWHRPVAGVGYRSATRFVTFCDVMCQERRPGWLTHSVTRPSATGYCRQPPVLRWAVPHSRFDHRHWPPSALRDASSRRSHRSGTTRRHPLAPRTIRSRHLPPAGPIYRTASNAAPLRHRLVGCSRRYRTPLPGSWPRPMARLVPRAVGCCRRRTSRARLAALPAARSLKQRQGVSDQDGRAG